MSDNHVLAELKHLETLTSTIIGFEGPAQPTAKELGKKFRALIDHIEGKPTEKVVLTPDINTDAKGPVTTPAEEPAGADMESEGAPAKPEPASEK